MGLAPRVRRAGESWWRRIRTGSGSTALDRISYLLVLLFVLVTIGPALIGRGALIDVDLLTGMTPFSALHGVDIHGTITCRTDTVNAYLPGISATKSAFWRGDFPTWSPYNVGGVPLASLPDFATLSPLTLPYYFLPLWLAPAYVKLGEFVVAIGGMFLFLRRLGLGRGASVLAGIVFASSGFMIMWTNWPHIRVAAFIPALFWGLERMVQQRRARDVAIVALVFASMLLGGFPAVTLYTLVLAGTYVLVRALTRTGPGSASLVDVLMRAASGVVLGFGLAAIQILPFIRNLGALGLDERRASGEHLPFGLLLTTVDPASIGLCVNGQSYGPVNPIEGVGFLGAGAVVLILCAYLVRLPSGTPDRSPRVFLGVAILMLGLLIWIGGPVLVALQRLPFFSTNSITRAQSVFGFLGAVLAGIGLDRLARSGSVREESAGDPTSGRTTRRLVATVSFLVVAAGFAGLVLLRAGSDAHRDGYVDYWSGTLLVPGLFLGGAVAAVLLTRWGPPRTRVVGPVLLAMLAVVQSTVFVRTMLPLSDPGNLFPVTPTHTYLAAHLGEDRWGATGDTLLPASATYYRQRNPVGHAFTDARWSDLLRAIDPDVAVSRTYSTFSPTFRTQKAADSPLLDQMAVRYWVAKPGDVPGRVDPEPAVGPPVTLRRTERGRCTVAAGPLRAVSITVDRQRRVPIAHPSLLHVAVHTPDGVREGSQLLGPTLSKVPIRVGMVGEDLQAGGRFPVDIWFTGLRGQTALHGTTGGDIACSGVRPRQDGLRLVFTESGALVYERLGALPRIRWSAQSRVETDARTRVADLEAGIPDDEVLLNDHSTPAASGRPAVVRVVADEPERISARVDASGGGYLVVADALLRDGWNATVDGRDVRVVPGNHAFAAIPVPKGEHTVVLTYDAPGFAVGKLISAVSGLVVAGLLFWPIRRPRWSRRRRGLRSDGAQR